MNILKIKSLFAAVMLLLLGVSAQAQTARSESPWRTILFWNMTFGGDAVQVIDYTNAGDQHVRAGELFQFGGGLAYKLSSDLAVHATVSYHTNSESGENLATGKAGKVKFSQIPIEGLLMYSVNPNFQIGAGIRYSTNATLRSTGGMDALRNADFKNSMGAVIALEYSPSLGGSGLVYTSRLVSQKFTENRAGAGKEDGSHFGIGMKLLF